MTENRVRVKFESTNRPPSLAVYEDFKNNSVMVSVPAGTHLGHLAPALIGIAKFYSGMQVFLDLGGDHLKIFSSDTEELIIARLNRLAAGERPDPGLSKSIPYAGPLKLS